MDDGKAESNEAAKTLSELGASKGGNARAKKLSPERRREIAQGAIEARWAKAGKAPLLKATHAGPVRLGNAEIPAYVLETGERVLATRGVMAAMKRRWRGRKHSGTELPVFLEANNLKPFISDQLRAVLTPQIFRTPQGNRGEGFKAEILPLVCEAYLSARDAGVLHVAQEVVAKQCEILMRGLARVGIVALVDEATGYQYDRTRDDLMRILDAYITEELRPWTRMFPEEFFKQAYRLLEWEYKPGVAKRNSNIGKWINKYIYEKLPPGVLPELRRLNPRTGSGYRRHKHFQFLTAETGNAHLDKQITAVTTIMKISDDREDFEHNFGKAFPKKGDQGLLPLVVEKREK